MVPTDYATSVDTAADRGPIVTLGQGALLGRLDDARPVVVYKGVPYGSMSSARRFQKAGPAPRWSGVRDATERGPAPIQPKFGNLLGPWAPQLGWEDEPFQSEDSLALNIWAPTAEGSPRPVIFFAPPGAFAVGSCDQPNHDGTSLAHIADAVVVCCNHRVGALGYLAVPTDDERYRDAANLGLLDIIQALEWVHDNIAAFGGDPGNVTIMGSSAGAHSVLPILTHPQGRRFVHRAAIQSASLWVATEPEAQQQTREFAEAVGITDVAIESFLGLSLDELRTGKPLGWTVCIDDRTVPATAMGALAAGDLADVPLLVGSTLHDGTLNILPTILNTRTFRDLPYALAGSLNGQPDEFMQVAEHYRDLLPDRSTTDLLMLGVTYGRFRYPYTKLLDAWSGQDRAPVYRYQFNWRSPAAGGLIGSCHGTDIPFWFGHLSSPIVGQRPPQDLAMGMATALGAFARGGSPACPQLPDWPAYDAEHRSTMVLDAEPHLAGQELYQEQAIWEEFAGPRAHGDEPYRNSWRLF